MPTLSLSDLLYIHEGVLHPLQTFPHRSFREEVAVLDSYFGELGFGSNAYVIHSLLKSQSWHVYSASAAGECHPACTLEICMTGLDRRLASVFYKKNAASEFEIAELSGISEVLPNAEICDFVFDPCGYSMNGLEGSAISTVHITPEDGCSYASFEATGYNMNALDISLLVERVLNCFYPAEFTLAMHANMPKDADLWQGPCFLDMQGYISGSCTFQPLPENGYVIYQNFRAITQCMKLMITNSSAEEEK